MQRTHMAEKAVLTQRFLLRKTTEYEKLRGKIEALQFNFEQAHTSIENGIDSRV